MLPQGAKEGVSHPWREEGVTGLVCGTQLSLCRCGHHTVHCHPAHAFLGPSFRPESVSLVVCSVLKKLRHAGRMSFALAFRVSFAGLSRTLPSSQLNWRFSGRRGCSRGQSQYIATCSSLRPPRSDGQARSGAARHRPTGTLEGQLRQA